MEARRGQTGSAAELQRLRARFMEIAARRVGSDDVEDVVQEALRIVAEKGLGSGQAPDLPPVAWSFQVLRNAIGNHYRRERTRRRRLVEGVADEMLWRHAEEYEGEAARRAVRTALEEMGRDDPRCARYLGRLLEETRPREIAAEEGVAPAVLYRRLHRCRERLRAVLRAMGMEI